MSRLRKSINEKLLRLKDTLADKLNCEIKKFRCVGVSNVRRMVAKIKICFTVKRRKVV